MAVTVKNTESKVTAPKRTITVKGAVVNDLRFVDETGDVTSQVLEQIPKDLQTIDVKISIELDSESEADKRDILKELEDFEDAVIEVSIVVKEETDLSNEE